MAFYINTSLKDFFKDDIQFPKRHFKKTNKLLLSEMSFGDLKGLSIGQYFYLRNFVKQTHIDRFDFFSKHLSHGWGHIYLGNSTEVSSELSSTSPIFSISKTALIDFLNSNQTLNDRVVFSFGQDDSNQLSLFVDIKKMSDGSIVRNSLEILNNSRVLHDPRNESQKKAKYLNNLPYLNKSDRIGISHVIKSQIINTENELGFLDFLNQYTERDTLYFYEAVGRIRGKTGTYKKIYFSFESQISRTPREVLYDRNGTCCPPQY